MDSHPVDVCRVELHMIELPLVTPFRTNLAGLTHRRVLMISLITEQGVVGWGECVAMTEPTYSEEYADGAADVTERILLPALRRDGRSWSAVSAMTAVEGIRGHRMAKAAVEMALLDAGLVSAGLSLQQALGADRARVQVGVSVGMSDTIDQLIAVVQGHLDDGYRRIKLKIGPGWDVEPCRAVRSTFGDGLLLQVDANQAYSLDQIPALRSLDAFDLLLIEQPFPETQLVAHAELAKAIDTPICLDETITGFDVALDAIELGATSIIAIKPGRVGGFLESLRILDLCVERGIGAWCGGMLETGVGRAANLAFASLPGFTLPGDISATSRYWDRDITHQSFELDDDGTLSVPTSAGLGVTVDEAFLARCRTDHRVVDIG